MADRKVFAGARLRRLRQRLNLSQTQMAAAVGVSPSYLNLIERNQRPLTVQVLLKLSAAYGIDVAELSGDDAEGTAEALKEVFADPLLAGEIASPTELSEFAEAAPNAARGVTRLFEAYREALERLSDLTQSLARGETPAGEAGASESGARLPQARVAAWFEEAGPHFPELEREAEEVAATLSPRDDPQAALRAHLKERLNVELRVLPDHVMPNEQLRFDRHTLRLFISECVPPEARPFLMARQVALLGHRALLERITEAAGFKDAEAARICRNALARRLAEAILAPGERLAAAARESGFDVLLLAQRFALSPARLAARLAALGNAGAHGLPPAFTLTLDASGAQLSRIAGAGYPLPRRAPLCPRLPLFDPPRDGEPIDAELTLADGAAYRVRAFAEIGPRGFRAKGGLPPPRRLTLLGWRSADVLAACGPPSGAPRAVGVTCRLCERADCGHRLAAPVAQPTGFHEHVVGPSDHELVG